MGLTMFVIIKGVKGGIEKWTKNYDACNISDFAPFNGQRFNFTKWIKSAYLLIPTKI